MLLQQDRQNNIPKQTSASALSGVYRHYKGNYYLVLHIATHTETNEQLVIYQSLYGDFAVWARPLAMFLSEVDYQNQIQSRFKKIAESMQVGEYIQQD